MVTIVNLKDKSVGIKLIENIHNLNSNEEFAKTYTIRITKEDNSVVEAVLVGFKNYQDIEFPLS